MWNYRLLVILPVFWRICGGLISAQVGFGGGFNGGFGGGFNGGFGGGFNGGFGGSVNYEVQFKYCRFLCLEKCSNLREKSTGSTGEESLVPDGFYWRDFYGLVPPDAYAVGGSNQNPQTYVGTVFDRLRNGTFVTTIFDGTPYVYSTLNGKTFKLTEHIQILCTMKLNRLVWMKLTREIVDSLKDRTNVMGGAHVEYPDGNKPKYFYHFIVKDSSNPTTYVGAVNALNATLEYAKIDGTVGTTNKFEWLMFITKEPEVNLKKTPERLCSRYYDYSFKLGTIPKFYRNFNFASCSFSCSQGDQTKIDKFQTDKRVKTSMAYYWKPKIAFKKEEALVAGYSGIYPIMYIGQSYVSPNLFDVGYAFDSYAFFYESTTQVTGEATVFNVFSTTTSEKFEWVNSTSTDFANLDKDLLIPGGSLPNGTLTYVGRDIPTDHTFPGSIRATPEGAVLSSFYGSFVEFQVLKLKEV